MTKKHTIDELPAAEARRLFHALRTAEEQLGSYTTLRQLMALLVAALAEHSGREVGVLDIGKSIGITTGGAASKTMRPMMHRETERKAGLAGTLEPHPHPEDLRRLNIKVSQKGLEALMEILNHIKA